MFLRSFLALLVGGLVAYERRRRSVPDPFVFRSSGRTAHDDFGDPRPQGRHEGNDVLGRRSRSSSRSGREDQVLDDFGRAGLQMLYLYGASGTTYSTST